MYKYYYLMAEVSNQTHFENIENKAYKPLIKWAGGKTRLNPQLLKIADIAVESLKIGKINYYEPFFGGGALFFELNKNEKINAAYINDIIPHLVLFYETIAKDEWLEDLFSEIESLTTIFEQGDKKQVYGSAKENSGWVKEFNELWIGKHPKTKQEKIKSAALFFVLNKTGFNGMFRLNKEGKFNIPKGDTDKINFDDKVKKNFNEVSSILKNTSIHCGTYEKILPPENEIDKKTSFIYLDPPYIPNSDTSNFTDYSSQGFKYKDHVELGKIFLKLVEDGNNVILSNNNNELAREIFLKNKELYAYEVLVSKSINSKKDGRGKIGELIVSTFDLQKIEDDYNLKKINF